MNIFDIAEKTGYSIATVSRAINNSGYVSEKARTKIMKVIEENNFSVNAFAKGMATSSMSLAGIISTDSRDIYQAECIYHLQKALREQGFTALLSCSGLDYEDKKAAVSSLLSRNVDMIFLIGSQFVEPTDRLNSYLFDASKKAPVYLLNASLDHPNIYGMRCDDARGIHDLCELTIRNGAQNPLMIIRRQTYSAIQKISVFHQACQEGGIDPDGRILQTPEQDGAYPSMEAILRGRTFDALICCDDEVAASALKYCLQNGISVPCQCQITGYNNSTLSRVSTPEITSYDNGIEYLCQSAVQSMKLILDKKSCPADSVYTGTLICRESTRSSDPE